jgi:hypothetical protein
MIGFRQFLERFGALHDCGVTRVDWKIEDKRFEIEIDDIWSNFEGLPEYQGPQAGRIGLEGVTNVHMDIDDIQGPLKIYDLSVSTDVKGLPKLFATFWPSGRIEVVFRSATYPQAK